MLLYVLPPQRTRFSTFFFSQCKCGHLSLVMTFELFRLFCGRKILHNSTFYLSYLQNTVLGQNGIFIWGNLFKYKERNIIRWSREKYKVISIIVFFTAQYVLVVLLALCFYHCYGWLDIALPTIILRAIHHTHLNTSVTISWDLHDLFCNV